MPLVLSRLIARMVRPRTWATPIVVMCFLFVTAWPLLALAEGVHSPIVAPGNYWWWFVVTASTVGYGDFYPESTAGHLVGGYVIIGGIVALTTLFTKLAAALEKARGRRMRGAITVELSDHTVLLGYTPGRTERIVDELASHPERRMVLCAAEDVASHPMPERDIEFVRGDLADVEVLARAGVPRARDVLVDVRDDNEALAVALAVAHTNAQTHVVVTLRDMARVAHLGYVDGAIRCVQWHTPRMVTEELDSPGIADVYAELMTQGGSDTYSVLLPDSSRPVRFGDCQIALGRGHGATVLAVRAGEELLVNPRWETALPAGSTLYYVSSRRLGLEEITAALNAGTSSGAKSGQ